MKNVIRRIALAANEKRTRNLGTEGRSAGVQSKEEAEGDSRRWIIGTLPSWGLGGSWESIFHPKSRGVPGPSQKGGSFSRAQSRRRSRPALAEVEIRRGRGKGTEVF